MMAGSVPLGRTPFDAISGTNKGGIGVFLGYPMGSRAGAEHERWS